MNLILTRTKDERLSVCWEPFATSTPLKAISNNVNLGKGSQKQLTLRKNSSDIAGRHQKNGAIFHDFQKKSVESNHLVSKRTFKNKSPTYCDLSSSDEDSSGESKKRPIIKLQSGRKTKSILFSKEQTDEKIFIVEKNSKNQKVDNVNKINIISVKECGKKKSFKSSNLDNIHHQSIKIQDTLNLDKSSKNFSISSEEESKVFDESEKEKNSVRSKQHSVKQESAVNHLLNIDSLTEKNALNETQIRVFRGKLTTNQISTKLVSQNNDLQSISSQLNGPLENKLLVSQKRKVKNLINNAGPPKRTRTKNCNSKLHAQLVDTLTESAEKSQYSCESKGNLTHQLFSNIREQEFINTLDLTSDENSEPEKNTDCFAWQKEKKLLYKSLSSPHPSNHKSFSCNESGGKPTVSKPRRKKQNCKKLVMQENNLNEDLPSAQHQKEIKQGRNLKVETKSSNSYKETQLSTNSELELLLEGSNKENVQNHNDLKKNQKTQKKGRKKDGNVLKRNKTSSETSEANKNIDDIKFKNMGSGGMPSEMVVNPHSELNKPSIPKKEKKEVNKKKPVFQVLQELSFEENKLGCSVVQCWNVNTFKSGVFKLKVKSEMKCKTLHSNSHLGGVLVKGKLRMKIGDKELDLKEGDMAFVPPLTEWQATNIGKCESVFYYWCGRFSE